MRTLHLPGRLSFKSASGAADVKFMDRPFEIKAVEDTGVFSGYVSVFGNVDNGGDIVAPGAFAETLSAWKAKGALPPVLWQHRSGEPLGPFLEMHEDAHGLFVKGQLLVDDVPRAREARALLKAKAITGMSIGYISRDDSVDRVTGVRTIRKADLWEGSIVTFPMNGLAAVSAVKGQIDTLESLADAERFLRDAGGLSKSEATAFISRIKSLQSRSESDELGDLREALKGLNATFF
jgi:uncharacterized protein